MLNSFVALDVETANNFRRSICSIGLAKFNSGKLVDTYYALVNPDEDFFWRNIQVHGIHSQDVQEAPALPEVWGQILNFIEDMPIIAHNTSFDASAVNKACQKYDLESPKNNWICTYKLSQHVLPKQVSYGLSFLCEQFGIELEHHRALSDAIAAGKLFLILSEMVPTEKIALEKTNGQLEITKVDEILKDLCFCFTGKLQFYTRKEAQAIVAAHGGQYNDNVVNTTNRIVVGEFNPKEIASGGTGKIKKTYERRQKGQIIEILSEDDFMKLISE